MKKVQNLLVSAIICLLPIFYTRGMDDNVLKELFPEYQFADAQQNIDWSTITTASTADLQLGNEQLRGLVAMTAVGTGSIPDDFSQFAKEVDDQRLVDEPKSKRRKLNDILEPKSPKKNVLEETESKVVPAIMIAVEPDVVMNAEEETQDESYEDRRSADAKNKKRKRWPITKTNKFEWTCDCGKTLSSNTNIQDLLTKTIFSHKTSATCSHSVSKKEFAEFEKEKIKKQLGDKYPGVFKKESKFQWQCDCGRMLHYNTTINDVLRNIRKHKTGKSCSKRISIDTFRSGIQQIKQTLQAAYPEAFLTVDHYYWSCPHCDTIFKSTKSQPISGLLTSVKHHLTATCKTQTITQEEYEANTKKTIKQQLQTNYPELGEKKSMYRWQCPHCPTMLHSDCSINQLVYKSIQLHCTKHCKGKKYTLNEFKAERPIILEELQNQYDLD